MLEVAQKEIQNLINIKSNQSEELSNDLKYSVQFEGDYDQNNFNPEISFSWDSVGIPENQKF